MKTIDFFDPGFDNPASLEDFTTSTIDWGDGTIETVPAVSLTEIPGSEGVLTTGTLRGTHTYSDGGIYTIIVTVRDDDGGAASVSATAYVTGVGLNNGILQIVGTTGKDHVQVKAKKDDIEVHTDFADPKKESFLAGDVTKIHIVLAEGDDHVQIHKEVDKPATIESGSGKDHVHAGSGSTTVFAGAGNDHIHGGDANDILYGGPGDDHIHGNNGDDRLFGEDGDDNLHGDQGNDILMGGDGEDKLHGGAGDDLIIGGRDADEIKGDGGSDILIAGFTVYDNSVSALDAIFSKWLTDADDYSARVSNVRDDTGSMPDDPFLAPGLTVFDDQSKDKVRGGSGRDLFFADLDKEHDDDDDLADLNEDELLVDLADFLSNS